MLCMPGTSISRFVSVLVRLSLCLLLNLVNRSSTIGVSVAEFATWSSMSTYLVDTEIHIPITSQGCNRLLKILLQPPQTDQQEALGHGPIRGHDSLVAREVLRNTLCRVNIF